jgi:hypothetical protein
MLVRLADSQIDWNELGNGYKGAIYDSLEEGERWVLYYSEQADKKESITLE